MTAPTGPGRVHICATTSDGVTYDLNVRDDPSHPMTLELNVNHPVQEVTDFAFELGRRYQTDLKRFVTVRVAGLVDGTIVRRSAPVVPDAATPAATGPEPEERVGMCGDLAPLIGFGGVSALSVFCDLRAGHAGWHEGGEHRTSWTHGPTDFDAQVSALQADVARLEGERDEALTQNAAVAVDMARMILEVRAVRSVLDAAKTAAADIRTRGFSDAKVLLAAVDQMGARTCTCPNCDVSTVVDRTATMKGWDKYCPIHGTPPPVTASRLGHDHAQKGARRV